MNNVVRRMVMNKIFRFFCIVFNLILPFSLQASENDLDSTEYSQKTIKLESPAKKTPQSQTFSNNEEKQTNIQNESEENITYIHIQKVKGNTKDTYSDVKKSFDPDEFDPDEYKYLFDPDKQMTSIKDVLSYLQGKNLLKNLNLTTPTKHRLRKKH